MNGNWERTTKEDTEKAYRKFCRQYQNSEDLETLAKLEEAEWRLAVTENTPKAYEDFLTKYPNSKMKLEAKVVIEDLAWEKAVNDAYGSLLDSYAWFFAEYPSSIHADDPGMKEAQALGAIYCGSLDLLKTALESGADPDFLYSGFKVTLLIQLAKAEASRADGGLTFSSFVDGPSVKMDLDDFVEVLLEAGADRSIRDKSGNTALNYLENSTGSTRRITVDGETFTFKHEVSGVMVHLLKYGP